MGRPGAWNEAADDVDDQHGAAEIAQGRPYGEAHHGGGVDAGEDQQRLGDAELHLTVGERVEAGGERERGVERGVQRPAHE